MADPKRIPPEVAELLKKGDKLGAMKLMLQDSKGGGGIIGRTVVEALESAAKSGQVNVKVTTREAHADSMGPHGSPAGDIGHRAPARSAGSTAQPRASPPGYVKRDGLSPGEVARTGGGLQAAIIVVAIAVALGLYFAFG